MIRPGRPLRRGEPLGERRPAEHRHARAEARGPQHTTPGHGAPLPLEQQIGKHDQQERLDARRDPHPCGHGSPVAQTVRAPGHSHWKRQKERHLPKPQRARERRAVEQHGADHQRRHRRPARTQRTHDNDRRQQTGKDAEDLPQQETGIQREMCEGPDEKMKLRRVEVDGLGHPRRAEHGNRLAIHRQPIEPAIDGRVEDGVVGPDGPPLHASRGQVNDGPQGGCRTYQDDAKTPQVSELPLAGRRLVAVGQVGADTVAAGARLDNRPCRTDRVSVSRLLTSRPA